MDKMTRDERRALEKKYREERRAIKKEYDENHYYKHKELFDQLNALDARYPFRNRKPNRPDRDFDRYHRHLRIVRLLPIMLILILWAVFFINSGLSSSIGIVILVFAILVTLGSIFQLIHSFRLEKRVLRPIERLSKGMSEIAIGNYDVKVEPGTNSYIDSLIIDFNSMAQKLREAEALKAEYENNRKDLIANISHDLKTPITSIQGYIEALVEPHGLSAEKTQKYLTIIHGNVTYMNRLIDDLFLFSKLDMQKLNFDFSDISVKPFMRDLMEELKLDLEEKGIAFTFTDRLSENVHIRIDTKRFHQVLKNILDNAEKYGPKAGLTIQSDVRLEPDRLRIDITDNGPGIPKDQLKEIFKRFYRLDPQRTKDTASTGLGLAIAKELIEMMGGQIGADNTAEGGTRFTIRLPALKDGGEQ